MTDKVMIWLLEPALKPGVSQESCFEGKLCDRLKWNQLKFDSSPLFLQEVIYMSKEPKKFEIVIMSSHGSGITALVRYFALTNCINTFYKAKYRPDRQTLEDFLNNIKEDHKACLCIDSSLYADIFEDIKIYLSKSFTLIDLNRCPYKRFESVINTHLIWWACRVAGLHDLPVKNTGVYATRNVENLICNLATDASMKANIVMFNYLRPMCSNYFFVDTNDITPVNVLNTLTKIFESLSIKNLSLKIPSYEIASRKIRIINDLIPLNISIHGKNIRCRALPSVLLSQFGYTDNDVLITCAKNKLNFFINKFGSVT